MNTLVTPLLGTVLLLTPGLLSGAAHGQSGAGSTSGTRMLRTPLPSSGPVPTIVPSGATAPFNADDDSRTIEWRGVIESLRKQHFRPGRRAEQRAEGLVELQAITDHAAFQPMIEILQDEKDDVRLALLEHFAVQGSAGQAALAWIAVHCDDKAFRYEATLRIDAPVDSSVLVILDHALRDTRHATVSNAASLANALDIYETIPLLIFNQATQDEYEKNGDLAWIAIGTQVSYVQDLVPVVGNGSAAFNPVVGHVYEGTVLAIQDAVVVVYRTEVHTALVNLSTRDWGRSTEHLGWDMKQWWTWYNDQYVPHKIAQAEAGRRDGHVGALLDDLERRQDEDGSLRPD